MGRRGRGVHGGCRVQNEGVDRRSRSAGTRVEPASARRRRRRATKRCESTDSPRPILNAPGADLGVSGLGVGRTPAARTRLLVVRQDADGTGKYSLSNAPPDTPWERLAFMPAQRFWIERRFQDAKKELGRAQDEVRGWIGWPHHMTLICRALLFSLKGRCRARSDTPLLSARDIVELLACLWPRRPRSEADVRRQMPLRHAARQRDLHHRRRRFRRNHRKKSIRV